MDKLADVLGRIKVYDCIYPLYVKTSTSEIGGNQNLEFTNPKITDNFLSLFLIFTPMIEINSPAPSLLYL
jgi:hypothetical protein